MFIIDEIGTPFLEYSGLDGDLTDDERAMQETARRFAREVMAPIGLQLDQMTPEDVCADGSPLFDYLNQFKSLGMGVETLATMEPEQISRLLPLLYEELGAGDAGMALLPMVIAFPSFAAHQTGDAELIERFSGKRGCWLGTTPDHGSDAVDFDGREMVAQSKQSRSNLIAHVTDDEIVLHGQSSAWVSGAPIAECALAYVQTDYGDGIERPNGTGRGGVILIPFDEKGVSKGKPLHKMGQRPLPQGEIFFDEVRLPRKYLLADDSGYNQSFFGALTWANMEMACAFTGLTKAAFEHALAYVHERRQGGARLIEHQSVRLRLYEIWDLLETNRAVTRRICRYNFLAPKPHILASITGKVRVTENAFEAASKALQLFGGNGLTEEYPMEKLFRDARAALIEDGENVMLSLVAAGHLSNWYKERNQL
ncbi:MAG: acyl-CoA dehydrogenase [Alphaproteobacteria bacterium HGW-Alphaproteobacteria-5]|nr:MAG: acyl-CoA dehydrogenase [Alphaproteobacteria bacterium HGW-Alphaproteobacteria-5]